MNRNLSTVQLCKRCLECFEGESLGKINSSVLLHPQKIAMISHTRNICTTLPLQRKKRQSRKYVPPIIPFSMHGDTHRLLRGANVNFDRYGPLFDKPDYTFLDGRPTPLTPEQMEQKLERRKMAEKVMKYTTEMENAKKFSATYLENKIKKDKEKMALRLKEKC